MSYHAHVYASPELILNGTPSNNSDQYSLAMTYLHLRTGELPPPGPIGPVGIDGRGLNSMGFGCLAEDEYSVILKATAKNSEDRFASCTAFIHALEAANASTRKPALANHHRHPSQSTGSHTGHRRYPLGLARGTLAKLVKAPIMLFHPKSPAEVDSAIPVASTSDDASTTGGINGTAVPASAAETNKNEYCCDTRGKEPAPDDHPAALPEFRALPGLSRAMRSQIELDLGYAKYSGKGAVQDPAAAIAHFREAARLGHPIAWNNMGTAYLSGVGVSRNAPKGVRCLLHSALGGYDAALCNLAYAFRDGLGVRQDLELSVALLEIARTNDNTADKRQKLLSLVPRVAATMPGIMADG